ncbi:MAG: DUF4340 domain-containing protein [Cyclobacteriaceae bacterium]|nr:DUF4340 domain-containing protein [Cyclobacteriaceae bacterium]
MLKNISNIKLIGILVALVLVYFGFEFFGGKSRSKSFRTQLVDIDTAKVSKVLISANGQSLELIRENNTWKVAIGQGKYAEAQRGSVNSTINTLLSVKPSRIAAKDQSKWKEYQVDSAGTRVQVFEGGNNTLDLIVGRFGFDQQAMQQQQMMGGRGQQQFYSYVRLHDEDEVYVADNFMGMSLHTDASSYRNRMLIAANKDSISAIQFHYPADSGFVLSKENGQWLVAGEKADSAGVAQYLNSLRMLSHSNFVDDVPAAALVSPAMELRLQHSGKADVEIKAFQHPTYRWIIHSSANPSAYFSGQELLEKLFVDKTKLMGN